MPHMMLIELEELDFKIKIKRKRKERKSGTIRYKIKRISPNLKRRQVVKCIIEGGGEHQ